MYVYIPNIRDLIIPGRQALMRNKTQRVSISKCAVLYIHIHTPTCTYTYTPIYKISLSRAHRFQSTRGAARIKRSHQSLYNPINSLIEVIVLSVYLSLLYIYTLRAHETHIRFLLGLLCLPETPSESSWQRITRCIYEWYVYTVYSFT